MSSLSLIHIFTQVLEEVPRVREDFGYPPLVTPTSQIVGTQAVMNVLAGERYKMVSKESKGLLRGEYGSCLLYTSALKCVEILLL